MVARIVERNSLRAMRNTTSTARMPDHRRADTASRTQLPAPNAASPSAMIHLPSGGCATNDGSDVKMFVLPGAKLRVGLVGPAALVAEVHQANRRP